MERTASRPTTARQASSRFAPLVSLNIRHDYFNADAEVCRAIEVRPTPQTVRRARQHGMAVLTRDDGFDLFVSHRRSTEAPFLFTMRLRDLCFAQYTDMPADLLPGDPPLLLSSRGARPTDGRPGLIVPDWSASAGGETEAERSASAEAWKRFGLFDLHLPSAGPDGGEAGVPPDLPSAAPTDPGIAPLVYELRFTARRTLWRYIVTAREGALSEESLEIVDPAATGGFSPEIAFERLADRRRLPDGRTAVAFVCRSAMPLRQRTGRRFALRGLPTGGDLRPRTLVDPLPVPSRRSTVFDLTAGSATPSDGSRRPATPWSDIYVFV